MLVIRGKLDRVCHEPDDEEYVVRRFERGVGLFGGLVHRERNHDQNQVLYDRFRGQGGHCGDRGDWRETHR